MRLRRIALAALLVVVLPSTALAWGKKKKAEEKKPLPPIKAGIHVKCLEELAGKKDGAGFVGLGMLDQTRGDLAGALKKYMDAFSTGMEILDVPVDLTLVNRGDQAVLWVQSAACPVPVPPVEGVAAGAATALEKGPEPVYPKGMQNVRSQGNVTANVWVGADGKASRIQVVEAGAGPAGIVRRRDPGEDPAERLVGRVQFALQAVEDLRAHDYGTANAGKVFTAKLSYLVPRELKDHLPVTRPNVQIQHNQRSNAPGL